MRPSLRLWLFLHRVESQARRSVPPSPRRKATRGHLGMGPRRLRRWREALLAEGWLQIEEQDGVMVLQGTLPDATDLRVAIKALP